MSLCFWSQMAHYNKSDGLVRIRQPSNKPKTITVRNKQVKHNKHRRKKRGKSRA